MDTSREQQFNRMTKSSLPFLIIALGIPSIISQLISSIYNFGDTFYVSQFGTSASAAVGVVFSLQCIIQAFGFGIGMGASSIISKALGKKDYEEANRFGASAFLMGFLFSILVMGIGLLFISPLMQLLGATPSILPFSLLYGRWILLSTPSMMLSFILNGLLRSQGKPLYAMIGISVGAVLNLLLDPIFMFSKGDLLHILGYNFYIPFGMRLGVSGAGLSTFVSQTISFIILLSFFLFKRSNVSIHPKYISTSRACYLSILKVGSPTLFRQGFQALSSSLLTHFAVAYGALMNPSDPNLYSDSAVSAISIVTKIYTFFRGFVIGIGQGFQTIVGFNYGAKKYSRIKKAFLVANIYGAIIVLFASLSIPFINKNYIAFFRNDPIVIEIGYKALYFYLFSLWSLGYSTYVNQMLQVVGYQKSASVLASSRQGIFFIPLIFILPIFLKLEGVLLTQPLADLLTALLSLPFQIWFFRLLKKKEGALCE